VPRVTNSTINAQGNTQNTVTYESVGIMLDVTPHINFDGLVTMDVRPEISDIAPASQSVTITEGVTSPTFFVNTAQTVIAARTGQTVAIGGLIRESEEESVEKIPLLGDIPLIGLLFSNTIKKTVKRELMIFLTPYVAYNSAQLEEITEMEKSKLKLLDPRDIDAEGDRWLEKMKLKKD
jgi:general secretion pathway protein D